jgi:hypothetical protein
MGVDTGKKNHVSNGNRQAPKSEVSGLFDEINII